VTWNNRRGFWKKEKASKTPHVETKPYETNAGIIGARGSEKRKWPSATTGEVKNGPLGRK
jgi:hypothetical protein